MTDFETHPAGTAARIEQLEAQNKELGNFLAAYMAEAFTAGRTVKELTEALTRANAATAASYEVVSKQLAASRETFCYASPGSDEEFTSLLLGFDTAAGIIRALATPDHTAALDKLIAEAVRPYVEALAWYGEQARLARLIHSEGDAGRNALQADGGKRANAILAASKKGGA